MLRQELNDCEVVITANRICLAFSSMLQPLCLCDRFLESLSTYLMWFVLIYPNVLLDHFA